MRVESYGGKSYIWPAANATSGLNFKESQQSSIAGPASAKKTLSLK